MPSHAAALSPEEADLLDWFLGLTPGERLDELQSRVDFLRAFRPDDDQELSPTDRDPEPARS